MTAVVQENFSSSVDVVEELEAEIKQNYLKANHHRALMFEALAEFDENGFAELYGESSTATWLRREMNLPDATAFEYVRVARAMRKFPLLFDTFRSGVIPYTTVRYLMRFLTEENEEELLDLALSLSFDNLQRCLAGADPAEAKAPEEPFVECREREDGMFMLRALLPAVQGSETLAALKIAQLSQYGLDNLGEEDLGDGEKIAELISEAEAEEEACPGEEVEPARGEKKLSVEKILGQPSRYGPPMKGDMYDAFLAMVGMVRTTPVSPLRSPGAQVNIMVTEDGRCWMPENLSARSEEVRHYVANARARLHVLDGKGLTLNVSRSQRFATDGQVQALLAAWGYQCAMPGCTHRRFIQIHHMQAWEDGGATDLHNLIPLCSSCHSRVSHGLVDIREVGGNIHFTFHDGAFYVSHNRGLPRLKCKGSGPVIPPEMRESDSFDDES